MNLLFSINRNYAELFKNCLTSVVHKGGAEDYDVYILHSDLSMEDRAYIDQSFGEEMCFHFIEVDEGIFQGLPEFKRYPMQIYYRLLAPELLPESVDRILYLDVDTIIINSLRPLYETDFEDAYFMACTHTRKLLTKINQVRLGITEDVPYINSGVMMMNLRLLREKFDLKEIQGFVKEKKNVLFLPDQDILTALYGDKIKLLDSMVYNLSDRTLNFYNADLKNEKIDLEWVRKNSVVIHYFGKNKPWDGKYHGILDVFYDEIKGKESVC